MPLLGLTVYQWSLDAQSRFLSSCLAPAVEELRQEERVSRFWFERMDIRGPHVFVPLEIPDHRVAEVSQRLSARIDAHLRESPCLLALTPAELKLRHDFCRGKLQSAADRLPGFARNNTFSILPHEERGYPFHLSAGLGDEEELWRLLTDLTLWSVRQTAGNQGILEETAGRWFALFEEAVSTCLSRPDRYWHHHAATLILNLDERLATEGERVLSHLDGSAGDSKRLSTARGGPAEDGYPGPRIRRIVQIVLEAPGLAERQRFDLLREIIHVGLKQLCLPVALHSRLVVSAWSCSLNQETAALAPAV